MCFRPSAVSQDSSNIQTGTCPTCGMPVAAEAGVTSGTCPHCGEAIPAAPTGGLGDADASQGKRIL